MNSGVQPDLGEEESRAVMWSPHQVSVQTLLGFVLSWGRHFWHLPHSAVGEALAYFQEPVGQPQGPSPPSSF